MREELKGPKVENVSIALVEIPLENNENEIKSKFVSLILSNNLKVALKLKEYI